MRRTGGFLVLAAMVIGLMAGSAPTRASPVDGSSVIRDLVLDIFSCQQSVCGKVVWTKDPQRRRQNCGRTIVWGLSPAGPDTGQAVGSMIRLTATHIACRRRFSLTARSMRKSIVAFRFSERQRFSARCRPGRWMGGVAKTVPNLWGEQLAPVRAWRSGCAGHNAPGHTRLSCDQAGGFEGEPHPMDGRRRDAGKSHHVGLDRWPSVHRRVSDRTYRPL